MKDAILYILHILFYKFLIISLLLHYIYLKDEETEDIFGWSPNCLSSEKILLILMVHINSWYLFIE